MKKILSVFLIIATSVSFAQNPNTQDFFPEQEMVNDNRIFDTLIHTVQLHKLGNPLSDPILPLNPLTENDRLLLSFDDFDENIQYYKIKVVHCDANWNTSSELRIEDYVNGYTYDDIIEYQFSRNTLQDYIHYEYVFPNDNFQFTKSGNYIIEVYNDNVDDPESLVLRRRFYIIESRVLVDGKSTRPLNTATMRETQEIDFVIKKQQLRIDYPYRDVIVKVKQNGRWDNMKEDIKPFTINNTELVYDFQGEIVFWGDNEYRNFDMKDLKYQALMIKEIRVDPAHGNQVFLYDDKDRAGKAYSSNQNDINGRRLIQSESNRDPRFEGDYAWVHFTFKYDVPVVHGDGYIIGAITDWQFTDEGRLKYNYRNRAYETKMYLKQGWYDYMYGFLEYDNNELNIREIEGSWFETRNEYWIFVYFHEPGTYYHQLVGIGKIETHQ